MGDAVLRTLYERPEVVFGDTEHFLGLLAFGDIIARTDVSGEVAGDIIIRTSHLENPPVFAVIALQSVFHLE